jgi:hypothetical protein
MMYETYNVGTNLSLEVRYLRSLERNAPSHPHHSLGVDQLGDASQSRENILKRS